VIIIRIFNNKVKIDEIIDDVVYYCNVVEKFPCTFIEDVKRALKSSNYGLRLHFFRELRKKAPSMIPLFMED
jgi:hypothetical protein